MSTWEERMAERAALRKYLRVTEAYANDPHALVMGDFCGCEIGTGPVVVAENQRRDGYRIRLRKDVG